MSKLNSIYYLFNNDSYIPKKSKKRYLVGIAGSDVLMNKIITYHFPPVKHNLWEYKSTTACINNLKCSDAVKYKDYIYHFNKCCLFYNTGALLVYFYKDENNDYTIFIDKYYADDPLVKCIIKEAIKYKINVFLTSFRTYCNLRYAINSNEDVWKKIRTNLTDKRKDMLIDISNFAKLKEFEQWKTERSLGQNPQ